MTSKREASEQRVWWIAFNEHDDAYIEVCKRYVSTVSVKPMPGETIIPVVPPADLQLLQRKLEMAIVSENDSDADHSKGGT